MNCDVCWNLQIIHLTSRDKSTLTRPEFFCALALVSLAQSSSSPNDVSIEKLSSSLSNLPLPKLKPSDPPSVLSGVAANTTAATGFNAWDGTINKGTTYSADSSTFRSIDPMVNSSENGWWKDKERIVVTLIPEKEGWFLQKYRIESDVSLNLTWFPEICILIWRAEERRRTCCEEVQ